MGAFKEFLIENQLKKAKQKALGLTHISYYNYKDQYGQIWIWKKSLQKFIKQEKVQKHLSNKKIEKISKNKLYNNFFQQLFRNDLETLSNLYYKIKTYVNRNEMQKFTEPEILLSKFIEDFVIKIEKWSGQKIYRGQTGSKLKGPFFKGQKFRFTPAREYTSWSFDISTAKSFFYKATFKKPPGLLLYSVLKEGQKTLNVKVFEDTVDRLSQFIKSGDWDIEKDQTEDMNKLSRALDFGMDENEILVFGTVDVVVSQVAEHEDDF